MALAAFNPRHVALHCLHHHLHHHPEPPCVLQQEVQGQTTFMYSCARARVCMRAHLPRHTSNQSTAIHTHIHAHMHTCTHTHTQTNIQQDGPLHAPIIRELETYLAEFKIIKECELDPKHNYVFAWHPHGRMFYGFGMLVGLFSSWFPEITNSGHDIFGGINDMMFRIPFVGNWLYLIGLSE
jgi:hypothetical protein